LSPLGECFSDLLTTFVFCSKSVISIDAIINQKGFHEAADEKNKQYWIYVAIGLDRQQFDRM
jgi:F0F1-type ATP synthase alpha subunit